MSEYRKSDQYKAYQKKYQAKYRLEHAKALSETAKRHYIRTFRPEEIDALNATKRKVGAKVNMKLILTRFAYTDMGVFGRITVDGVDLYTVERPWLGNAASISCIPNGTYKCKPRWYSGGGYDAVEVLDVPNRTHILMHIGNTMFDSAGCILINSKLGWVNGMWAGQGSKNAFSLFMEFYNKEFDLKIEQYKLLPALNRRSKFTI